MSNITDKLDALLKEQDKNWERYQELVPESEDLVAVVLKGHLIIEEMLYDLVKRLSNNPELIDSAHLSFKQLNCLAQALILLPIMDKGWEAIKILNTLRNKLAHNLEPRDVEKYIIELERLCSYDKNLPTHYKTPDTTSDKAKASICFIIGQLNVCIPISDLFEQHRTINFEKNT